MTTAFENRFVAVVDDDPFQLKMLSHLLTTLAMPRENIKIYLSGVEMLASLNDQTNAQLLIMLDLNMPEMDGVEVVRRLSEQGFPGSLVLVSGEDKRVLETVSRLAEARDLHVLGHLDKPVQREQLAAMLLRWGDAYVTGKQHNKRTYSREDLERAILQRELFNMYQPKVDLATGALVGLETLVRWQHPVDGLVFPDAFIAVAEQNDLIDELTRLVLSQALDQAKAWQREGLPLRLAVNVSMDNLDKLDFADYVLGELNRTGYPAQDLILEVTESRVMKDPLSPLDILTRLRLKHISLSIDDFGTGHSSLAQLRDMPFDELKVDRGFVHGAAKNPTLRGIFEGSMAMARQLQMKVVAEGVEDLEDWHFLQQHGCDLAQGYFISRPLRPADLIPWRSEWEARRKELAAQ